jgi:prevent-host-death family protein
MSIKSDIRPITYLKSKASDLLKQINETHRHVIITQNGEPKAVLQDPASFEEMKTALTIMKLIHQSEEAIRKGEVTGQEDVFNELEKRLKDP